MTTRAEFARQLADRDLTHEERAIALLWFYRQSQEFEERTASDLANDLYDEGFPKPNVTRLKQALRRSHYTISGRVSGSFQIDVRLLAELESTYAPFIGAPIVEIKDSLLPSDWVTGTRRYLEKLVIQINGSYQYGFFDACAVLARRLMESLIIEIYICQKRHSDIQANGIFLGLEALIGIISSDTNVPLSRSIPATMRLVKDLGDVAAHDRTYLSRKDDIDDLKQRYRRMIAELLRLSGIVR
jgi:hypothetical protein